MGVDTPGMHLADWFLTPQERGNPAWKGPSWTEGNLAVPRVHGATYFDRLVDEVEALQSGDHLFFTDWRGDPDQLMRPDGPTLSELFAGAARRGVVVKGLLWRSHSDDVGYSEQENRELGDDVAEAGGEVLLDGRVRRAGSHHQKLVVLRHPGRPELDVAFAGGIDLCHNRRDDASHAGDPQPLPMAQAYGPHPPWHDTQLELRGPVVGALDTVFRERWTDPHPIDGRNIVAWVQDKLTSEDLDADPLPEQPPDPQPCGPAAAQVLRTYPRKRPPYPFAPRGERSIARAYRKAVLRARRLIYVEDQYMWSPQISELFADALRDNPRLHLVVVVPRHADVDGRLALPPNEIGRAQALEICRKAAGDRVHVFDVENHAGTPVYVHAKVCVVDDVWATIGSDNFNRRSWSHDSELCCAVLDSTLDEREPRDPAGRGDGARRYARELRLTLWREHMDLPADGSKDDGLVDPEEAVRTIQEAADELDAWHRRGRTGPRPPGRVRPHQPEEPGLLTRIWAEPVYRLVYDPDGRSFRAKLRGNW